MARGMRLGPGNEARRYSLETRLGGWYSLGMRLGGGMGWE